jgi:protoheme IX farnesyltransferase
MIAFDIWTFIGAIGGTAFIIASACVANNVLDRDIDKQMKRTTGRNVPSGDISITNALAFCAVLGVGGFLLLAFLTNPLTVWLGVAAFIWYVAIYGIAKRTTPLSTLIGGVAGSLPPVAGYTALTGRIDMAAVSLFVILFFWQLPHFYAIAMFRKDDYASAKLPVWAAIYGMKSTKFQVMLTTVLYGLSVVLLTIYGYTGIIYLVLSLVIAVYWIYKGISLYKTTSYVKWARTMFGVSLMVLLLQLTFISVGGFLP